MQIGLIGYGRFGKLFTREMLPYADIQTWDIATNGCIKDDTYFKAIHQKNIVLAVPMQCLAQVCSAITDDLQPGQRVIDVCSLKSFATKIMLDTFSPTIDVVPTHPLFGPQSAKNGIDGQKIAICRGRGDNLSVINFCKGVLGLEVIECTPEKHDEEMTTQLLTHFIGRVAERMGIQRVDMSTQSFEDLMDIIELVKGGSAELFLDMQTLNPFGKDFREKFIFEAIKLHADIEAGKF